MKNLFLISFFLLSSVCLNSQIISEKSLINIAGSSVTLNIRNIGLVDSSDVMFEGYIVPQDESYPDTLFISYLGADLSYSSLMEFFHPSLTYGEKSKFGKLTNGNHYVMGCGVTLIPEEVSYVYNEFDSNGILVVDSIGETIPGETIYGAVMLGEDGFYRSGMITIDGKPKMFIDKCNRFAGVEWSKTYTVCADTESISTNLYIDPSGNMWNRIIIANSADEYSYAMAKTDKDGNLLWVKPCGANTYYNTFDQEGNFYCITGSFGNGCEITKYDPDFNLVQTKTIETASPYSKIRQIFFGPSGMVLGGMASESEAGPFRALLIETDENLNPARENLSTKLFEGYPLCKKFFMDKNKLIYSFYVDQTPSQLSNEIVDYVLINLKQTTTGVEEGARAGELQISPNPIGASVTLTLPMGYTGEAKISIINSIGNCVRTETARFESGAASIKLTDEVSEGVYFVQVSTPAGIFSAKAIKAE